MKLLKKTNYEKVKKAVQYLTKIIIAKCRKIEESNKKKWVKYVYLFNTFIQN